MGKARLSNFPNFPIISLDSALGNWKVLSFYEMFLSVKNLILLGGTSRKDWCCYVLFVGMIMGGATFFLHGLFC